MSTLGGLQLLNCLLMVVNILELNKIVFDYICICGGLFSWLTGIVPGPLGIFIFTLALFAL